MLLKTVQSLAAQPYKRYLSWSLLFAILLAFTWHCWFGPQKAFVVSCAKLKCSETMKMYHPVIKVPASCLNRCKKESSCQYASSEAFLTSEWGAFWQFSDNPTFTPTSHHDWPGEKGARVGTCLSSSQWNKQVKCAVSADVCLYHLQPGQRAKVSVNQLHDNQTRIETRHESRSWQVTT